MSFIKRGDVQITHIIESVDLTEDQKNSVKKAKIKQEELLLTEGNKKSETK
jgi:hypothetical protein